MIFSDPAFVVFILLPFSLFAVVDRGLAVPFAVRVGFVMALSLIYYWHGPGASPSLLALFVVGNYVVMRLIGSNARMLISLAVINIAGLFYLKAALPGGAPLGIS